MIMYPARDPSPFPNISIALFNSDKISNTSGSKKRSSRPSLEEDLKKDLEKNKENLTTSASRRLSRKWSRTSDYELARPRGLSSRLCNTNADVFQYPSPREVPRPVSKTVVNAVPRISVYNEDDEVFDGCSETGPCPPTRKLLLTPSTARTPLIRCSGSSSQYLSSLIPSPNIDRGVCCSTPNRLKLESEGLSSTEKMVLGRGAFGTVVLGRWKGRKVAIKVMEKEEGVKTARRRKSLESELQAKQLEHPNIVKVFDVYAKDNQ